MGIIKAHKETFRNGDGWWNKHIKNTGPVEYQTRFNAPHWQCTKCEFNDANMETVRRHVFENHEPLPKKMWNEGEEGNDSQGG